MKVISIRKRDEKQANRNASQKNSSNSRLAHVLHYDVVWLHLIDFVETYFGISIDTFRVNDYDQNTDSTHSMDLCVEIPTICCFH